MPLPSVSVEPMQSAQALHMIWQKNVQKADVHAAFQRIQDELQSRNAPLYVIVDITSQPNFPMFETLNAAMSGPYRNTLLKEWLVVGTNRVAQTIERVLAGSMGRDNVRWFTSEAEALAYLERVTQMDSCTG